MTPQLAPWRPIVGHFHGELALCAARCCPLFCECADLAVRAPFDAADVAQGLVGPDCDRCSAPLCSDEQLVDAQTWLRSNE